MDSRLVGMSRSVDPADLGRRIRLARLGAGMTQADVAADDVSAAYLSRIEAGQRRPEFGLLVRIADRIGVAVADLLTEPVDETVQRLQVALDHAELKLVSGDAEGALADVTGLVGPIAEARAPALVRAATFVHARCREAVGEYNEAILLLEDLTAEPSVDPAWLKASLALCRCYRQAGDAAASIAFGERAVATAADLGLAGVTEAIQLSVTVAWAYATLGDNDRALRICLRALETADKHGASAVARGSAYWNASIIQSRRGNLAQAADFAHRALAIFEEADDNRALASLRTEVADIHLAMDPPNPDVALSMLDLAEREMAWSAAARVERGSVLVTRARAHVIAGDIEAAVDALARARDLVSDASPVIQSYAASLAGQVAVAQGRREEARAHYGEAVRLLSGLGADRRVGRLWCELGDLLAQAGDYEAAVDAFRSGAVASGALSPSGATLVRGSVDVQ